MLERFNVVVGARTPLLSHKHCEVNTANMNCESHEESADESAVTDDQRALRQRRAVERRALGDFLQHGACSSQAGGCAAQ